MFTDYFLLALKNLKHKGIRSWLTMIGIFIGIAAVVSLITMGQGLQEAITGQFGTLSVDVVTIQNKGSGFGPPGSTVAEKLNEDDLAILETIQNVKRVVPRLIRVGKLEYNKVSGFGYIADIPEKRDLMDFVYDSFRIDIEEGRLLESGDTKKVLLGNDYLDTEDFTKKIKVGKKIIINDEEFEIAGILKKSDSFQLNSVIFMMHDDMVSAFKTQDTYDLIVVQAQDKNDIEGISEEIERKFRKNRGEKIDEESFTVETPLQALSSVNTILNIINLIVIGIAGISLFVGGVGIANTMYTSVLERTKEIGTMKAIGAQNKDILMIFLIESGLLGLAGGIIGAIIGLSGAFLITNIANQAFGENIFTIVISYPLLIGAILFSFFVGILSGILPARQASKLNVVDALRN